MPGTRCTVAVCNNSLLRTKKIGVNITYHQFPIIQPFRAIWIQKCGRIGKWNPDTCHICSCHFTENDYRPSRFNRKLNVYFKRKLKSTAIPSLFLTEPPPIDLGPWLKIRKKSCFRRNSIESNAETIDSQLEETDENSTISEHGTNKTKGDVDLLKTMNQSTENEILVTPKFPYYANQMSYEELKQIESKEQYSLGLSHQKCNAGQVEIGKKKNNSQEENKQKYSTTLQCQSIVATDFSMQTDSDHFLDNYKKLIDKKENLQNDLVKWINRYRKLMSYMKYLEAKVQKLSFKSIEA